MKVNMINFEWSTKLKNKIPDLYINWAIIEGVKISKSSKQLDDLKKEIYSEIKEIHTIENIKDDKIIKSYRQFFWKHAKFDPTKIRPAAEALVRRMLTDRKIPFINNVVFACNIASIKTHITFSAFNLDNIEENLLFRYSKDQEPFEEIGGNIKNLKENQVILTTGNKILSIYPHRDSNVTKVDENTKNLLLLAYGIPDLNNKIIKTSIDTLVKYVTLSAGGELKKSGISRCSP